MHIFEFIVPLKSETKKKTEKVGLFILIPAFASPVEQKNIFVYISI